MLGDGPSPLGHRGGPQPPRAVGAAHQRAGHDALEPQVGRDVGPVHELLRLDPPVDRVVLGGGAQVLGDREDVAARVVQVADGLLDLGVLLAHAQDEVALGDQLGVAGHGEHPQRLVVGEGRADPLEDARHRLEVVREHLGAGVEHLADELGHGAEVGREDLDAGVGVERVDLADRLGVEAGGAVGPVVAGDAGDGGVAQAHRAHRLGDPAGLVEVERLRPAGGDVAEVAAPGAGVAADEEGGLAVLPALEDVGAAGLLAHGVQALALDHGGDLGELRAHLGGGADPLRLALDRGLRVARLDPQHAASLGCDSHPRQPTPGVRRARILRQGTRGQLEGWPVVVGEGPGQPRAIPRACGRSRGMTCGRLPGPGGATPIPRAGRAGGRGGRTAGPAQPRTSVRCFSA